MRDSLKSKVVVHRNKLDRSALRRTVTVLLSLSVLMPLTLGEAADFQAGLEAYERGDYAVALREWRPLAEQGHPWTQFMLGLMYADGEGVPKDDTEAVKWYRKAAEQGEALAQTNLGVMYDNGKGVPEDDAEAVKWYRKAAEQGEALAQAKLGLKYDTGEGVPEDDVEAVKWYRKAAEQGNALAQSRMGSMYASGEGVPQDYVEAHAWLNIYAAQGNKRAEKIKQLIAERMTREQRARAQELARRYWEAYVLPFRN